MLCSSHKTNQANVCAKRHWLRTFKPQTKHPHLSKPICQLKIRSSDLAPATPSQGFCQVSHVDWWLPCSRYMYTSWEWGPKFCPENDNFHSPIPICLQCKPCHSTCIYIYNMISYSPVNEHIGKLALKDWVALGWNNHGLPYRFDNSVEGHAPSITRVCPFSTAAYLADDVKKQVLGGSKIGYQRSHTCIYINIYVYIIHIIYIYIYVYISIYICYFFFTLSHSIPTNATITLGHYFWTPQLGLHSATLVLCCKPLGILTQKGQESIQHFHWRQALHEKQWQTSSVGTNLPKNQVV